MPSSEPRPPQGEALAVWALYAADALAVLVVYSLLDPSELYNVSRDGIDGGLSRLLFHLNFPIALAALPLVVLALGALPQRAWLVGAPALVLCAFVAVPGVVDQSDLDARPVNGAPAIGVVLALSLTLAAARRAGTDLAPERRGDRWRIAAAVVALLVSLPWLTAELGFHLPGGVFMSDELHVEPGELPTVAVHLGHHHGLAGTLFVLSALVLSRTCPVGEGLRRAYAALVSLTLAYGTANLVQDFWHEQVVKRDWTSWDVPSALVPRASVMWGLVLVGTALAYALGFAGRHEAAATGDNPTP
jgi:hypothetical protein